MVCHTDRKCIAHVAHIDCREHHDAWHCAIYHRWVAAHEARAASATSSSTAWAWTYTTFDNCVATHESTLQQDAWNGNDASYYQWEFDAQGNTWVTAERDVGVMFTTSPFLASLEQQTYVFNLWEPVDGHRTQWPVTVPECGG